MIYSAYPGQRRNFDFVLTAATKKYTAAALAGCGRRSSSGRRSSRSSSSPRRAAAAQIGKRARRLAAAVTPAAGKAENLDPERVAKFSAAEKALSQSVRI